MSVRYSQGQGLWFFEKIRTAGPSHSDIDNSQTCNAACISAAARSCFGRSRV